MKYTKKVLHTNKHEVYLIENQKQRRKHEGNRKMHLTHTMEYCQNRIRTNRTNV